MGDEDKFLSKNPSILNLSNQYTDILIKSFNRPYYLDRCLKSIEKMVSGNVKIKILDDGTPPKYLEKIQAKYPHANLIKSDLYAQKVQAIEDNLATGKEINGFQIPTDLWYQQVNSSSPYVLVTEDDVWFTHEVNLDELTSNMKQHAIELLKLGWLGNFQDDRFLHVKPLNDKIHAAMPTKIFTSGETVMDFYMYNRFKFFSLLCRLGLANNNSKKKYWNLNSILMGLYKKEYWLHIWKDAKGKVDEKQQLKNAAVYFHHNKKNKNFAARTSTELMKTTFQSSATNSYHRYGFDFDVNYFNHLINEAWYRDEFDTMQNFPSDFDLNYFEGFLDEHINKQEFRSWVEKFKNQYRNLGAQVD